MHVATRRLVLLKFLGKCTVCLVHAIRQRWSITVSPGTERFGLPLHQLQCASQTNGGFAPHQEIGFCRVQHEAVDSDIETVGHAGGGPP